MWLNVGYAIFKKRFRKRVRAEYQNKLVANQQYGACLLMMRRRERSVHMMDISRAERWQKDRDGG